MRRATMIENLTTCLPSVHRSGVKEGDTRDRLDEILSYNGVQISKMHKWFRALVAACAAEDGIWRDMTPLAWANLGLINPGSADIKRLKDARAAVKRTWREFN